MGKHAVRGAEEVGRVELATTSPADETARRLNEVLPGVVRDGTVDAQRIAELLGMPVVGAGPERFGLSWAGKAEALATLHRPGTGALAPDPESSIAFDTAENVFIEGDNLEVLKLLQKAYDNKVKLIYIDPPYNTGSDLVYQDGLAEPVADYLARTGQTDASGGRLSAAVESAGRGHSRWLSMMAPRIAIARNLLADDGIIMCSIDDHEAARLRDLLDDQLGPENFVAELVWASRGGGQDTSDYALQHEYVLVYARNASAFVAGRRNVDAGDYPQTDRGTGRRYKRQLARKWGSNSRRVDRPNLFYAIAAPDGSDVFPKLGDGSDGCWRWSATRFAQEIAEGNVEFLQSSGVWTAYERVWEPESGKRSVPFGTLIPSEVGNTATGTAEVRGLFGAKVFSYPKPTGLVRYLMAMAGVESGDLVVDFFAGSGTSGDAVVREYADRVRYLLVNLDESVPADSIAADEGFSTIAEIARRRLVLSGAAEFGLRSFRLAPSGFVGWDDAPGDLAAELDTRVVSLRPGVDDDAIAAEVLLKEGVTLDLPWIRHTLASHPVVESGPVAVCLARASSDALLDALAGLEARTVVMLDTAFDERDSAKANAFYTLRDAGKTLRTV